MVGRVLFITLAVAMLLSVASNDAHAQAYDPLVECTALSTDPDDIHVCMDNYLDLMDDGMDRITEFLAESLSGDGGFATGFCRIPTAELPLVSEFFIASRSG